MSRLLNYDLRTGHSWAAAGHLQRTALPPISKPLLSYFFFFFFFGSLPTACNETVFLGMFPDMLWGVQFLRHTFFSAGHHRLGSLPSLQGSRSGHASLSNLVGIHHLKPRRTGIQSLEPQKPETISQLCFLLFFIFFLLSWFYFCY